MFFVESVQESYEQAISLVENVVNDYLQAVGVEFPMEYLDQCMNEQKLVDVMHNPIETGQVHGDGSYRRLYWLLISMSQECPFVEVLVFNPKIEINYSSLQRFQKH